VVTIRREIIDSLLGIEKYVSFANLTDRGPRCQDFGLRRDNAGIEGVRLLEEFKKFALRGNVIDLAVGVIIGAAFGAIVASMVSDIIMPVIGALTGGLDFSNYFTPLSAKVTATTLAEAKKQGAVLAWGNFLTVTLNFIIIAFVLFLAIRAFGNLIKKEAAKPAPPPPQEVLLTEIRDLLKAK
jgi:large conductance mechanosensitive channel